MLRNILLGLALLIGVCALVIIARPPSFHIERSGLVPAPPEVVFAQVSDFRAWSAWSPWEKIDPAMRKSFSGAQTGPGAVYSLGGTNLYAINGATGKTISSIAVGSTSRFATPMLVGKKAYVGTMTGIVAVNVA